MVCRIVVASVVRSLGSLPAFAMSRIRLGPPSTWASVRSASRRTPSGSSRVVGQTAQPVHGVGPAGQRSDRCFTDRAGIGPALSALDQAIDELLARSSADGPDRLDRSDSQCVGERSVLREGFERALVPGVACGLGKLDRLGAELGFVESFLDGCRHTRIVPFGVPRARNLACQGREQLPLANEVPGSGCKIRQDRRPRGSAIWRRMSSPACSSSGAREHRDHLGQKLQALTSPQPPRQAEILAQGRGRLVGRAGLDEGLVAVDREIRRQGHLTVPAFLLKIHRAEQGAVEQA